MSARRATSGREEEAIPNLALGYQGEALTDEVVHVHDEECFEFRMIYAEVLMWRRGATEEGRCI
jgi:hypothetical protein